MDDLLTEYPHLSFDEVWRDYQYQFISTDKDIVQIIYEDVVEQVKERVWDGITGGDAKEKQMEFDFADCG